MMWKVLRIGLMEICVDKLESAVIILGSVSACVDKISGTKSDKRVSKSQNKHINIEGERGGK